MPKEATILSEYLHSRTLGSYSTNLALITLAPVASFWLLENEPTVRKWSVFAHEYSHFLHNFSTIAGLHDFLAHLRLEGLFIQTVGADGRSHGMTVLSEPEKADLDIWLQYRHHLRGEASPPFSTDYHRRDVQIEILDVASTHSSLQLSTQPFPVFIETVHVSFTVSSASAPTETCTVQFGAWQIMEALAYEIEKAIHKANGDENVDADSTAPIYPYRFGRLLFEHRARTILDIGVFARVCLMSLQSTDPGAAFMDIANAFGKRRMGERDDRTLSRLEQDTMSTVRSMAADFINRALKPEIDRFAMREPHVGKAIATLGEMCLKYVDLRSNNLFFELQLFEQPLDRDRLRKLIESYPPCPIVHEANADGVKEFINLSLEELPKDRVDSLCVYQTFCQFMLTHLRKDGFRSTSECPRWRCVFFGACVAPQASQSPELCRTRPWSAFRQNEAELCTYAAGVSASRGRP